MIKIFCAGACICFGECVCSLLIRRAGGTTVSCVLELVVPDLLHLLRCYYSVKSCCVFPGKGSYFISTFCLSLNVSDALSAIFTCFNSALHPNQNIQPFFCPITVGSPRKIGISSIGVIPHTRFQQFFFLASADSCLSISCADRLSVE